MKHIITLFSLLFTFNSFAQQVSKTVIVEHFTNTYCSVCTSKNPDLYTNLDNNPDILHIAYHPSVPYSQCPLNQHNTVENDERTKFYNLLTGTPRIIIQGELGGSNFGSSTLFDGHTGQTSSFSMTNSLEQDVSKENLILKITIKKEDASALTELTLYSAIVEETLNFNADNGETVHHDVFRKSFVGQDPITITLPENVGDVVNLEYSMPYDSDWEGTELKTISILQHSDKTVEQASESSVLSNFEEPDMTGGTVSLDEQEDPEIDIYPTIFTDKIFITPNNVNLVSIEIYDSFGREVYSNTQTEVIDFSTFYIGSGVYTMLLNSENKLYYKKIAKEI